ncbi:Na(+)-translocating NADH-quinone reductase subunit C [Proteus mirabilis]|uniref:Na(+)-translocating NADH-quinone reductase subunit C n=1 Tax=Proteus mirabilis TaxID=584 RepID=A0A379FI51_PROMI|nr:Na(+)-translocating NADH-quinone reductase subunit C [Proteus mirabilis]
MEGTVEGKRLLNEEGVPAIKIVRGGHQIVLMVLMAFQVQP